MVYQHIMLMVQSNSAPLGSHPAVLYLPDAMMVPREFTDEEIQQMNADYYAEMDQQRFEAQHGEFSTMDRALDLMGPAEGCDLTQEATP